MEKAVKAIKEAEFICFLIGTEMETFAHMEELNFGPFEFWKKYPVFKKGLKDPV